MTSISWQRNLYIIVAVEFAVLLAYGFTSPFMPFFIQDLGSFTDSQAAFWSGLTTTAFGLTMFLSGPIWGIIADRWGRKPMVLRAIIRRGGSFGGDGAGAQRLLGYRFPRCAGAIQRHDSGGLGHDFRQYARGTKFPFAMGLLAVAMYRRKHAWARLSAALSRTQSATGTAF